MRVWFYRSQYRGKGADVLMPSAVWLLGEPKLKLRWVLILSLERNIGLASRFGRCNFGCRAPGTHLVWRVGVCKGMAMFPRFFFLLCQGREGLNDRPIFRRRHPTCRLNRVYEETGFMCDIVRSMVFWDLTPCSLVDRYQRVGWTSCSEDKGSQTRKIAVFREWAGMSS